MACDEFLYTCGPKMTRYNGASMVLRGRAIWWGRMPLCKIASQSVTLSPPEKWPECLPLVHIEAHGKERVNLGFVKEHQRSINSELVWIVRQYIERQNKKEC